MVRRLFVSAFSSVVAVTASALYSAGAAKAQGAPPQPRYVMSFPEPEPIVVDQATADRGSAGFSMPSRTARSIAPS